MIKIMNRGNHNHDHILIASVRVSTFLSGGGIQVSSKKQQKLLQSSCAISFLKKKHFLQQFLLLFLLKIWMPIV